MDLSFRDRGPSLPLLMPDGLCNFLDTERSYLPLSRLVRSSDSTICARQKAKADVCRMEKSVNYAAGSGGHDEGGLLGAAPSTG